MRVGGEKSRNAFRARCGKQGPPRGTGWWYMNEYGRRRGAPPYRSNMVAEVWFIGSPWDVCYRLPCALRLRLTVRPPSALLSGRGSSMGSPRAYVLHRRGYFPLRCGGSVGGAVLEARSWAQACCSQCDLGARYFAKSDAPGVISPVPRSSRLPGGCP